MDIVPGQVVTFEREAELGEAAVWKEIEELEADLENTIQAMKGHLKECGFDQ